MYSVQPPQYSAAQPYAPVPASYAPMYSVQPPQYGQQGGVPSPGGCGVTGCPCPPARSCDDCGKRICAGHTEDYRRSRSIGNGQTMHWTNQICPECKEKAVRCACIKCIVYSVIVVPILVFFLWLWLSTSVCK